MVITGRTRNALAIKLAREFESHRLRQKSSMLIALAIFTSSLFTLHCFDADLSARYVYYLVEKTFFRCYTKIYLLDKDQGETNDGNCGNKYGLY